MNIVVIISGKKIKINHYFLDFRHAINPGKKISFAKYRHVKNSEASGFTTCRYSRVITVLMNVQKITTSIFLSYEAKSDLQYHGVHGIR